MAQRKFNALPGFGLTLGFTLVYLTAIVLVPFGGLLLRTLELSWSDFWKLATTPRALAAYQLTFGASLVAALANAIFGTLLAWVLVRYRFPGRRLIDAIVDFPFALPTAVAGLTLANLFSGNGWLGRFLVPLGIHGAFTQLGVVIALTFVGMPFVVRTLQPVLQNLEREVEEAAATLGAPPLRAFWRVTLPLTAGALGAAWLLAFVLSISAFVTPHLMGGGRVFVLATEIYDAATQSLDWPAAAALSVYALLLLSLLGAAKNAFDRRDPR